MIKKNIIYFGKKAIVYCDGKCDKAWGINSRPIIQLDENNIDDYAFLADDELGEAPTNPGTYEGFEMCGKPINNLEKLNKWCVRECERSSVADLDDKIIQIMPKNFNKRVYNIEN